MDIAKVMCYEQAATSMRTCGIGGENKFECLVYHFPALCCDYSCNHGPIKLHITESPLEIAKLVRARLIADSVARNLDVMQCDRKVVVGNMETSCIGSLPKVSFQPRLEGRGPVWTANNNW